MKKIISRLLIFLLLSVLHKLKVTSASVRFRATSRGMSQSNDAWLFHTTPVTTNVSDSSVADSNPVTHTSNSNLCPIGSAEKVVYKIPPYKNKLAEVSYMAHSSQLYNNKAVVVW